MGSFLMLDHAGARRPSKCLGGAVFAGSLIGALVIATVGGVIGRSLDGMTLLSASEWPLSGVVPLLHGPFTPGSSSGGSAASGIDAAFVATSVDPAVVDITSTLTDGVAAGTGMVITPGGQVLTNNHVVDGSVRITGQIDGAGRTYPMSIIDVDPTHDIALLQLEGASNLRTVSVGDSTNVGEGDPVLAIGNGLGRGGTPSTAAGTVVALGQTITATDDSGSNAEALNDMIETNADIQPGYSGGPLVNARGQVIGMDTAASTDQLGEPFGSTSPDSFAIPITDAMSVVDTLRNSRSRPLGTAQLKICAPSGLVHGGLAWSVPVRTARPRLLDRGGNGEGDLVHGHGTARQWCLSRVRASRPVSGRPPSASPVSITVDWQCSSEQGATRRDASPAPAGGR